MGEAISYGTSRSRSLSNSEALRGGAWQLEVAHNGGVGCDVEGAKAGAVGGGMSGVRAPKAAPDPGTGPGAGRSTPTTVTRKPPQGRAAPHRTVLIRPRRW